MFFCLSFFLISSGIFFHNYCCFVLYYLCFIYCNDFMFLVDSRKSGWWSAIGLWGHHNKILKSHFIVHVIPNNHHYYYSFIKFEQLQILSIADKEISTFTVWAKKRKGAKRLHTVQKGCVSGCGAWSHVIWRPCEAASSLTALCYLGFWRLIPARVAKHRPTTLRTHAKTTQKWQPVCWYSRDPRTAERWPHQHGTTDGVMLQWQGANGDTGSPGVRARYQQLLHCQFDRDYTRVRQPAVCGNTQQHCFLLQAEMLDFLTQPRCFVKTVWVFFFFMMNPK